MHKHFRFLATLALLGALPLVAEAQRDGDRVDTTLTISRGGLVQLDAVSGQFRVVGSSRSDVRIQASIERGRLELSTSSSRIGLRTRSVGGRQTGARFEVEVPVGTRVAIGTVSGTIVVVGTMGEVTAKSTSGSTEVRGARDRLEIGSVSGEVDVRDATGRMSVESVSGTIHIEDVEGDLRAEAVSGDVNVRRARLTELRANAMSGSVRYEGTIAPSGSYRLNSHSGSITMTIPAGTNALLDLETFSGRINTDFPLTLQPGETGGRRGRRMEFTLGQGGARITAGAFSGSINIRRGSAGNRD